MHLWVISKFGMVQKRSFLLYLLWLKYAGVFTWEWRGNWGPWGLLYAMRIRLTGDVIWKDSEFIFLFPYWLFIELLRVKNESLQASRLWSVNRGNRESMQDIEWRYSKWMEIFSLFFPSLSPSLKKDTWYFSPTVLWTAILGGFEFRKIFCYNWATEFLLLVFYLENIWNFVRGFLYSGTSQGIPGGKPLSLCLSVFVLFWGYIWHRSLFKCCVALLVTDWTYAISALL